MRGPARGGASGVIAYPLGETHRVALLAVAADAIGRALTGSVGALPEPGDDPALAQPGASFVSLARGEALLRCTGSLVATEALVASVARNAGNAASADPRLPAITADDFAVMSITVSVLSPLAPVRARSWRDVRRAVRPGHDGLLVEAGDHRATLLPSAWAQLPSPDQFLDVLWHKAGLRPRDWLPGTAVRRYSTEELTDPGPRAAGSDRSLAWA
ncbi:MAG: AmmeMemoRadiSam system protein A [Actinomycetota bacterium]